MTYLAAVLCIIFLVLAGIHFYWLLGGKKGLDKALPEDEKGAKLFQPSNFATAVVAVGLSLFALYYFNRSGVQILYLPNWLLGVVGWVIPVLFLFRAIGDFKYVGFFKKVKQTEFGQRDTRFYAPLCLFIAIIGMVVNS